MTLVEVSPGLDFLRLPPCLNVSVVKKTSPFISNRPFPSLPVSSVPSEPCGEKHRLRSKRGAFPKVQGFYSGHLRCSLGMAALRYSAFKLLMIYM